jgi:hypothetical protein
MPNYRLEKGSLQWDFNQSRAKMQIFGGAFANGKTTAAVIKALQLAKDYPGCNGLIARETYPKLNDTIRKEFFRWCPPHWIRKRPTQEDNTCYFHNGSVINFRYIAQRGKSREDGTTTSNLLSATYDWIVVDQVEDPGIGHKDLLDLVGRLRGQTPYRPTDEEDSSMPSSGPRWIILTANPSPNWFFKEIVQPYLIWKRSGKKTEKLIVDEETGLPVIDLFEGSTYTNQANLPKDYIRNLEAMYKGQMRDRFLLGKWAAYEGLVHGEFSRDVNMLPRSTIMDHLSLCLKRHVRVRIVEGYDFGLVSPSCYMLAFIDDYGRMFIIDGYYKENFHYTLQPEEIFRIRDSYSPLGLDFSNPIQADPAIFKKIVVAGSKNTGDTLAKLYKDEGIITRAASNEVLAGIAKINGYINGRIDIPHLITGETPGTLLYVCDDIEFFEDEITSYYWKRNPAGQNIDEPMDSNDHAMNTLKYMLAHLPHPSKIEIPKTALPPGWMMWQERDIDEPERQYP